jgi:hypothetical protein
MLLLPVTGSLGVFVILKTFLVLRLGEPSTLISRFLALTSVAAVQCLIGFAQFESHVSADSDVGE